MGRSIRSKRGKRNRNKKRERYSAQDLEKLKKMTDLTIKQEQEMKELYNVKTSKDILMKNAEDANSDDDGMDVDKAKKKYSAKTLKDEHGSYPNWMNHRSIKRLKKKEVRKKKGFKKRKAAKK